MITQPRVHVMHVPGVGRDENVARLVEKLDCCVHLDPDRTGVVNAWAGVMDCMSYDEGEWSVQVNDDAVTFDTTADHLPIAVRFAPRPVVGLAWSGVRRGMKAVDAHVPYVVGPYLLHGLAIGYHCSTWKGLREFSAAAVGSGYENDDILASLWCQRFAPVPFLPALVGRSLFGTLPVKSLLGRATYPTAFATIENGSSEPYGGRRLVRDNYLARRDDEDHVTALMRGRLA